MNENKIPGYKGFKKDWKCNGMQYKVGETAEIKGPLKICGAGGLHFCTNPFDVLAYYPASDGSKYAEVEGIGNHLTHDGDSKIAVSKLHVKCEIGLKGLINSGLKLVFTRIKEMKPDQHSSGDRSTAASSGYSSTAASSGYRSTAASSGYRSTAASSGDSSTAASSGDNSTAAVSGKESIAMALGREAKAKGAIGCWLILDKWEVINNEWHRTDVKIFKVDGKKVKADTFYSLVDGKLKIAE